MLKTRSGSAKTNLLAVSNWFHVNFDEERATLKVNTPGQEAWEQSFTWSSVERVCFKSEGLELSDGLYIFTNQRPESFVLPTDATGGVEFLNELMRRKLLPAELIIKAAAAPESTMLCWPQAPEHVS